MPFELLRPDDSFSDEKREELAEYLCIQWERAEQSRQLQVDDRYVRSDKNYYAQPAEKVRSLPWTGASNLVVPLSRIFLDTFIARSLGIILATRPIFTFGSFPADVCQAIQIYTNHKALNDWRIGEVTRDLLFRGGKNGTAVVKTPWVEEIEWRMIGGSFGGQQEKKYIKYAGPCAKVIPFEDFAVYPYTANYLSEAEIVFHRVRYIEEEIRRRAAFVGGWNLDDSEIDSMLRMPDDIKRQETSERVGISDRYLREGEIVECHLRWPLSSDPLKLFPIVACISPTLRKLVDLYFSPYSRDHLFIDYRPFRREDCFYGESVPEVLEQLQEEASTIHNDRRNNSYILNSPQFKRKVGSKVPNPSTTWYPGKVWDVENMDDFDVLAVGGRYDSMIDQENKTFELAGLLLGQNTAQQGMSIGSMNRGVYNTQGTLAVMSESNQRQDSNIYDVRTVISKLGRHMLALQAQYGPDDPVINFFPPDVQELIRGAFQQMTPEDVYRNRFEIRASNSAANAEVQKAALINLASTLAQYSTTVQQMAGALADPNLNPVIRNVMMKTVEMQKWLATKLLRAYDEYDAEGILPDVAAALEEQAGNSQGAGGADGRGAATVQETLSRQGLQAVLQLPEGLPGEIGGLGMGM